VDDEGQLALAEICRVYWYPAFVRARSKFSLPHHEAEDLTQGFWLWLLEGGHLSRAAPERGKFRSFLMTCFDHFILHEWRKQAAQKRGGRVPHVSIQSEDWNERFEREMGSAASPSELLERVWEEASLQAAFHEVEVSWKKKERSVLFTTLKAHLADGAERGAIGEIAKSLDMTENNLRQWMFKLRKELKETAGRWLGKSS